MPTALGTLEDARKILIDRVRRDEDHLSRETAGPRSVRLLDGRPRPQSRLDSERVSLLNVALDEALAFSRHRATNMPGYRTVAAQNLRASLRRV